jgi:hypothetical protein
VAARSKVGSAAARLLGLRVRILPGAWMSFGSDVCFQVQVSTLGGLFVQRSHTECGVSECDREAWTMGRPWPNGGFRAMKRKTLTIVK